MNRGFLLLVCVFALVATCYHKETPVTIPFLTGLFTHGLQRTYEEVILRRTLSIAYSSFILSITLFLLRPEMNPYEEESSIFVEIAKTAFIAYSLFSPSIFAAPIAIFLLTMP